MKKFFAKIHLWLSIPFGIIIAIVCLTGAILVFETEILEFCYPSRYFVKEIKSEPLSPAVLMGAADQQLPDSIKINGIRVSSDPKRTYQLILPGKKAACFINPYTGEITGIDDGKGAFTAGCWTNINGMEVSLGVKLLSDIQPWYWPLLS